VNRVEITGTPTRIPRVHEVDGVHVVLSSIETLPDGRYRVGGYATDAQVAALRALDLEVLIVEDSATRSERLQAIGRAVRESAQES
jgi:hypothetical protein